jgi:hypothetical protein
VDASERKFLTVPKMATLDLIFIGGSVKIINMGDGNLECCKSEYVVGKELDYLINKIVTLESTIKTLCEYRDKFIEIQEIVSER